MSVAVVELGVNIEPAKTPVRERPILFSAQMVRAILEGRKTQTRRILTRNNSTVLGDRWGAKSPWDGLDFTRAVPRTQSTMMRFIAGAAAPRDIHLDVPFLHPQDAANGMAWDGCVYRVRPQWEPGELLWVREAFAWISDCRHNDPGARALADGAFYRADELVDCGDIVRWRPSIHMPRWASRITLRITDVRVERLNEISEEDCLAEGIERLPEHQHWRAWRGAGEPRAPGLIPYYVAQYRDLWEHINGLGSWAENPWVWVVAFERVTP